MNPTKTQIDALITRTKASDFGGIQYHVADNSESVVSYEYQSFRTEDRARDYMTSNQGRGKKVVESHYDVDEWCPYRYKLKVWCRKIHTFTRYNDAVAFIKNNYENITLEF